MSDRAYAGIPDQRSRLSEPGISQNYSKTNKKKKTKHEGREVHLGLGSYSCETCLAFTIWTCITFIETIQEVN